MATNIQFLPWDNTMLSNFKLWGQAPGTALTAFGWTKSATPLGTVNWSTLAYTPYTANPSSNSFGTITDNTQHNFANAWYNNNPAFSVTSVATSSGGTAVYTGTFTGGAANGFKGTRFVIAGFGSGNNNGTFQATASTATTLTLNNAAATAQAAAATANVTYLTGDIVTNNNGVWLCTQNNQPTSASPAPPYEWLAGGNAHWALYVFEVWQSPGSPTIYLRLEFCGGQGGAVAFQNAIPRMRVGVGVVAPDTSGNIGLGNASGGSTFAIADMMSQTNPTTTTALEQQFPCYFSGDTGGNRIGMLMWPDLNGEAGGDGGEWPSGSGFFCFERSLTNTGSYYTTPSGVGFVQGVSATYTTATSQTAVSPANVTSGNLLIALISNGGTNAGTVAISDTRGSTWNSFYSDTTVNGDVQKAWWAIAPSSGPNTVTVSWTTGALNSALATAEYQGIAASPLDQNPATKTGTAAWSSNSATTTQAVELAISVTVNGSDSMSIAAPFTQRETLSTPSIFGILGDAVLTQTQTINSSGGGAGNYANGFATFKASPNTSPVTPYFTTVWWGASSTSSTVGSGFIGAFMQLPGSNSWIQTQFDNRIWTISAQGFHSQFPDTYAEASMSGMGNQSVPAFPIWPLVGWVGNPLTAVMTTKISDGPNNTTFTIPLYGATRTFLGINRNGAFFGFGTQSLASVNGLAMRFD